LTTKTFTTEMAPHGVEAVVRATASRVIFGLDQ
jgi:hypothetical protein